MTFDFLGFYKNSPFARNALTLTIGTTIAQFLPLLIYPILARIYSPEQFGILASLTSVISILTVISTGKYEFAILVAKDDKDAANITCLSLVISLLFLLIILLPLYFFRNEVGRLCGNNLEYWILICPFAAFFINIFNCYNEWCVRKKYYFNLSLNKITNSVSVTIGKLVFGFTKFQNSGLIIGDIIGRFITALCCVFRVINKDWVTFKKVSCKGMKNMAIKFIEFPKFTMPAQLLNTVGGAVPVLILGAYYNNTDVGYFSMAITILSVPISVISISIRDTFRQKANEIYLEQGNFRRLFVKLFKILLVLTLVASLAVIYFLPDLFAFVLGKTWSVAGKYAQILLPMIAIDFIAISLSGVLIITNKLKQNLIWQLYYTFASIAPLIIAYLWDFNIYWALILFSTFRASAYIYLLFLSFYYSKGEK